MKKYFSAILIFLVFAAAAASYVFRNPVVVAEAPSAKAVSETKTIERPEAEKEISEERELPPAAVSEPVRPVFVPPRTPLRKSRNVASTSPSSAKIPVQEPLAALTPASSADSPSPGDEFRRIWAWIGAGLSYTQYSQSSSDQTNLTFESAKAPVTSVGFGTRFSRRFGLEACYRSSPGDIKSSASIQVVDGDSSWNVFSLEALIYLFPDRSSEWILKLGGQLHELPFIVPDPNGIRVIRNRESMASLGAEYRHFSSANWETRYEGRVMTPISSRPASGQGRFEVSSPLALEASIGQIYRPKEGPTSFGVFWRMQSVNQKFRYSDSPALDLPGTQNLFNTGLEARLIIEF